MRTLLEAAQLAGFYSDARELPKAAVRYTLRKYVNKPRKSAPGLVSLSTFKTVLVEPQIGGLSKADR
jgi:predicted ribosome quality control (RQC) complex YloA/Tae2 family protein